MPAWRRYLALVSIVSLDPEVLGSDAFPKLWSGKGALNLLDSGSHDGLWWKLWLMLAAIT